MACCAFAVFLLGQIYMAIEAIARALGLSRGERDRPTATDWHWGAPDDTIVAPERIWKMAKTGHRLVVAGSLSVVALTVAIVARPHVEHFDLAAYLADPAHICGHVFSEEIR